MLVKGYGEMVEKQGARQLRAFQDRNQSLRQMEHDRVGFANGRLRKPSDAPKPLLVGQFVDRALTYV